MLYNKKILAVIPTRGGSKGIPRKNIRELAGKPLIAWTIAEAKKSKYIDRCIVSTEDEEIMQVAEKWGGDVPFKRPTKLAEDDSPGIDTILHAIDELPAYDCVMMLQATSPLRTVADIDGCIEYFFRNEAEACVSVTSAEANPYWMYTLEDGNRMKPILSLPKEKFYQRQKLPIVYQLNGAVYIAEKKWLMKNKSFITEETLGYVMPINRSYDIDTEMDFIMINKILKGHS